MTHVYLVTMEMDDSDELFRVLSVHGTLKSAKKSMIIEEYSQVLDEDGVLAKKYPRFQKVSDTLWSLDTADWDTCRYYISKMEIQG